jgi:hypothetical protein
MEDRNNLLAIDVEELESLHAPGFAEWAGGIGGGLALGGTGYVVGEAAATFFAMTGIALT